MNDLTKIARPLSYYKTASVGQVFATTKAAAAFHFAAASHESYWRPLKGSVFLDLFVDEFQGAGFPLLKNFNGTFFFLLFFYMIKQFRLLTAIVSRLDSIAASFSREFVYYSLLERPRELSERAAQSTALTRRTKKLAACV